MLRTKLRVTTTAALAVLALLVVASGQPASAAPRRTTFFDYGSDQWTYRQVAHGRLPRFQDGTYQDNGFRDGQAGFGTKRGACSSNNPEQVRTRWRPNADLLLRQTVYLPEQEDPVSAGDLRLTGTVADAVDVYLNGDLVAHVDARPCQRQAIDLALGDGAYGFNELALRATSSTRSTFIDVKLTGVLYDE